MRDFTKTSEPKGQTKDKLASIFVVQKHAASHLHYDFRLSLNGVLKSWAIPKGPCLDPKIKRLAVEVEDHPLDYAYFEGNIPKGQYGGGTVTLWDKGSWTPCEQPASTSLKNGKLTFHLEGEKLKGNWVLLRTKMVNHKQQWILIKQKENMREVLRR